MHNFIFCKCLKRYKNWVASTVTVLIFWLITHACDKKTKFKNVYFYLSDFIGIPIMRIAGKGLTDQKTQLKNIPNNVR